MFSFQLYYPKAKGVSIENFKKYQEEIFGRYDSGFFGYRGLQGIIILNNELPCNFYSKIEDDILSLLWLEL